ncbi:hypothetical protein J3Q64DRAFT_1766974 [Phycomyces blakesleeanus]|uniref:Uncharacterized protein n=2 Tax=Phycomyces blakesleeanus TaxID=4837 RepID=A0A167N6D0_PHYB8|nr:hypothetical protein PHYBLDRAFT_181073 [Phycomyces blakesleeanus NRRL 1555(-)]OAD75124.1 hypothetical protein PHYBLDRAFT_181073 [Phycomyces blakesleeanus NRRL 1555(-)]|eukprot:XP_018293164.1 hypothetical protein PHYBLDRAFT_181073 [Phycomyces blakesleeanus NRRL 1555(-)]
MSDNNSFDEFDDFDDLDDFCTEETFAILDRLEHEQEASQATQLNTLSRCLQDVTLARQQEQQQANCSIGNPQEEIDRLKHMVQCLQEKIECMNEASKEEEHKISQERIQLNFQRQEIESQKLKMLIVEQAKQLEPKDQSIQSDKKRKIFPDQSYFHHVPSKLSQQDNKTVHYQTQSTIKPTVDSVPGPSVQPIAPLHVLPLPCSPSTPVYKVSDSPSENSRQFTKEPPSSSSLASSEKRVYTPSVSIRKKSNRLDHLFASLRNDWSKRDTALSELDPEEAHKLFINQLRPDQDTASYTYRLNQLANEIDSLLRRSPHTPLQTTIWVFLRLVKEAFYISINRKEARLIARYLEILSVLTYYYDEACFFMAFEDNQGHIPSLLKIIKSSIAYFTETIQRDNQYKIFFCQKKMSLEELCNKFKYETPDSLEISMMVVACKKDVTKGMNYILDIFGNLLMLPVEHASSCLAEFPLDEINDIVKYDTKEVARLKQLRRAYESMCKTSV